MKMETLSAQCSRLDSSLFRNVKEKRERERETDKEKKRKLELGKATSSDGEWEQRNGVIVLPIFFPFFCFFSSICKPYPGYLEIIVRDYTGSLLMLPHPGLGHKNTDPLGRA